MTVTAVGHMTSTEPGTAGVQMIEQIMLSPLEPFAKSDSFTWVMAGIETTAESNLFYRSVSSADPKDWSWRISGWLGTLEDETYRLYSMSIPFLGNEALVGTYKLGSGLRFYHSQPYVFRPGAIGVVMLDADEAEMIISRYDPKEGIVEGTFKAEFNNPRYRLVPDGKFVLTEFRD